MKCFVLLLPLIALAACGVDGDPEPPEAPTMAAHIGISESGVHGRAALGVSRGPVTLILGI